MWLIWSVARLLTSVLVHAIVMRFVERAGTVAIFVAIGGMVGGALIGYCLQSYGFTPATLAAFLHPRSPVNSHFPFYPRGNSVSFGLLTKLESHPLDASAIARFYRAEAMIGRRSSS